MRTHIPALGLAAALIAQGSLAQPGILEEVIVTAQKRDQSVQDVPSTVNVLSASMLEDFTMKDFSDLEQLTPGLVAETRDSRSGSISLRGIDYNPNSAAAQAVDVYWNDTPVRGGGGVFQQIFDLQRIEVLKGPQGTLQGRSSPAGAIMLHTAQADMEEVEGSILATFADNAAINTSAAISLPIIPGRLSTRLAAVFDESDLDQIENIVTGNETSKETKAARVSVSWLPSDTLSVDFAYQYLDNETVDFNNLQGAPLQDLSLPTLNAFDRKGIQFRDGLTKAEYQRASLKLAWDIGNHQLTWLSGWSDVDSVVDTENLNSEAIQTLAESQAQILVDDSDFISQELRLNNTDADRWEYMFGLYYSEEDGTFDRSDFRIGGGPDRDRIIVTPFNTKSSAVFTHHIVHLSDALTAQFGLRWQKVEAKIKSDMFAGPQGLFGLPEGSFFTSLIPLESQQRSDNAITGAVTLQYHLDDPDTMIYGSYSTGYRPGGVTVAAVDLGNLLGFSEEDSWAVELGFKSTLLDGRATLGGAVFYQEFDNYIARLARISVSTSGNSAGITDNADAKLKGAELEFNMLLTDNWQIGGGVSYTQAEFQDGERLVCNDIVGGIPAGEIAASCDAGGTALGPQPDLSASFNSEYILPFGSNEAYVRGLLKYNGKREDTDINDLDAYQTIDLYLGIRSDSRQWDISLFARNLFDEEEIIRATPIGLHRRQPTGYQAVDVVSQRVAGIKAAFRF